MSEDFYLIGITILFFLTASLVVSQVNPYHALVIRGILGALAALVYAMFGAADVALTEALVGTMLSITLYAIAVRSSLSMRLGILMDEKEETLTNEKSLKELLLALRTSLSKHHLRLEIIPYEDVQALQSALETKEIHTTCILTQPETMEVSTPFYALQTRVKRLYNLMESEALKAYSTLTYVNQSSEK